MKPAFAALIAICVAANVGCRCLSSTCIHENQWDCIRGNAVWQPGTPGGLGCEGGGCLATSVLGGCGCQSSACDDVSGCGIESTRCSTGSGCASRSCASGGCASGGCASGSCASGSCASGSCGSGGCASGGCASGGRASGGCDNRTTGKSFAMSDSNFAPIVNGIAATQVVISDGGGAGGTARVIAPGRGGRLAGGRAAGNSQFGDCPRCGGDLGVGGIRGGCGRCGLGLRGGAGGPIRNVAANNPHVQAFVAKAANRCENGFCNRPAGPEVGAVQYPYYTTRGPRDFLSKHPANIGP